MATIGTKSALNGKYTFGEDAEIANRDKVGFQPAATNGNIIGPNGGSGSLNDVGAGAPVKSGNLKFGSRI